MFQRVHFRRFLQSSITISGLWPYMHDYKLYWGLKMYECKKKRRELYFVYVSVSNKGKCSTVSGYEQNFRLPSLPPSQLCVTHSKSVAAVASVSLSVAACCPALYPF